MKAAAAGLADDLPIVGAGIVGPALAAVRLGKRVVVIDKDAQANGASIRNFGFATVTPALPLPETMLRATDCGCFCRRICRPASGNR